MGIRFCNKIKQNDQMLKVNIKIAALQKVIIQKIF